MVSMVYFSLPATKNVASVRKKIDRPRSPYSKNTKLQGKHVCININIICELEK